MQTIHELVRRLQITAEVVHTGTRKDENGWAFNGHTVTLRRPGGREMITPFRTGLGWTREPTAADVLDSLSGDASGYRTAMSFEDWAIEYGHDSDSRKAEKIYKACGEVAGKLAKFMDEDLDELLYETERL